MYRSATLLALLCMLAACAVAEQDIEGEDKSPLQASLRFVVPTEAESVIPEGQTPERQSRGLIELSGDFARGDFDQDDTGIPTDYILWQANLAPRYSFRIRDVFEFDIMAGLTYGRIDLDFEDMGTNVDRDEAGLGPIFGLEVSWLPVERLAVYGRASFAGLFPDSSSGQAEAGLRVDLFRGLHAFGGYRHWRFRHEGDATTPLESDIDLKLNGFVFGAELRF